MKITPLLLGVAGVFCVILSSSAQSTSAAAALPAAQLPPKAKLQIYLLMGQSNMAGRGKVSDVSQPNDPHILSLDQGGRWVIAKDPLHWDKPEMVGVGPGLGFAIEMVQHEPGVTIGLVPCAVGGTPLSQWSKGGRLFEAAVTRAREAMKIGTLSGVLWHQGEADALPNLAPTYATRLQQMIKDLRAALGSPSLPIVLGETGRFANGDFGSPLLATVNKGTHAAAALPDVAVVDSKGLKDRGDKLHFDAVSQREFGRRYAEAMISLQKAGAR